MTVAPAGTDAEMELSRNFAEIAAELPGGGWMPKVRDRAIRGLARAGLPHRRLEAWKYTDLRTGLKSAFPPARCSGRKIDDALLSETLGPKLAALRCLRVVLVNGRFTARLVPEGSPAGAECRIASLAGALGEPGAAWMEPYFETDDGAIKSLNTAFVSDGVVLSVAAGTEPDLPVHIVSIVDADRPVSVATRSLIDIEAGAHAVVIESHIGIGGASAMRQATAVTHLRVAEGADLQHIQILAGGTDVVHLGQWDVELGRGAAYRGFQLTAGGALVRNETNVRFEGPDAKFDLSGLMLGRGRDHIDTTLVVNHSTTGCESRELFKAVLDDRARGVFQGKVIVAPDAQKTDGKQMAQALMLSEDAEFDSKPELEIYADDVACGHGSTAAELDADQLFYLRARGIPPPEARAMLIESFAAGALEKIASEDVREAARAMTVAWLGGSR